MGLLGINGRHLARDVGNGFGASQGKAAVLTGDRASSDVRSTENEARQGPGSADGRLGRGLTPPSPRHASEAPGFPGRGRLVATGGH